MTQCLCMIVERYSLKGSIADLEDLPGLGGNLGMTSYHGYRRGSWDMSIMNVHVGLLLSES